MVHISRWSKSRFCTLPVYYSRINADQQPVGHWVIADHYFDKSQSISYPDHTLFFAQRVCVLLRFLHQLRISVSQLCKSFPRWDAYPFSFVRCRLFCLGTPSNMKCQSNSCSDGARERLRDGFASPPCTSTSQSTRFVFILGIRS